MGAELSDSVLLREFASEGSQAAFRTLVERHQDMVFSAALRRLGHQDAAAEVTQNVFAALARKAVWLSNRSSIGGWLYKSSLLEAARRQRDDTRRYNRERLYAEDMKTQHSNNESVQASQAAEWLPLLDDAMSDLPSDDREALVLRFFRGLSLRETGHALGTSEEAARKRVSRAVDRLAGLFRRRGVVVPAAVLVGTVLPRAVDSAPAFLAANIAASATAAPSPGLIGSLYLKWLALGKAHAIGLCVLAAAIPIGWQQTKIRGLAAANRLLEAEAAAAAERPLPSLPQPPRVSPATPDGRAAANGSGASRPEKKDGRTDGRRGHFGKWRDLLRKQEREGRLAALREQVALNDDQMTVVVEATEEAAAKRRELRDRAQRSGNPVPSEEELAITEAREAAITAALDDDQLAAYAQFLTDESRARQEVHANRMLSEIQDLHLTDEQKDRVFAVFAAQAAAAERAGDPLPHMPYGEAPSEEIKQILGADQLRMWQERIDFWSEEFEWRPGPRDAEPSRPPGEASPAKPPS